MPKNSFLQAIFPGPKFSLSPIEKSVKGTARIGEVFPVFKDMLNPRESIDASCGHLVRFSPMNVPVMEGYETRLESFSVPLSAIGYAQRLERNIDDFHNLNENDGTISNPLSDSLPNIKNSAYWTLKYGDEGGSFSDLFRPGSLGDYLNLPSFKAFRDFVREWVSKTPFIDGGFEGRLSDDGNLSKPSWAQFACRAVMNAVDLLNNNSNVFTVGVDLSGRGYGTCEYILSTPFLATSAAIFPTSQTYWEQSPTANVFGLCDDNSAVLGFSVGCSLLNYILNHFPAVANYYGFVVGEDPTTNANLVVNRIASLIEDSGYDEAEVLDYLGVLYRYYKIDAQTIYDEWFERGIMSELLYNDDVVNLNSGTLQSTNRLPNLDVLPSIDLSYIAAYWKIISDWYINTNIDGDPNEFFLEHFRLPTYNSTGSFSKGVLDLAPFKRRWANDVFTSSVPQSAVTNIDIPSDGTIPDLREANAYQRLVDILRNTGKRLRDVVFGIRGIHPSAVRSEMAEPNKTLSSYVEVGSILQTSETTANSPQASFAGTGTDGTRGSYRGILKVVNNAEPTPIVVMVLMSVTQRASYMQGFDRMLFRNSIYDFAIPQLANIGEQEVYNREIYFDYNESASSQPNGIFGFNRRYYDWFFHQNECHGMMRDSEDFWTGTRIFDETPALNAEFISMDNEKDNLSRIFTNSSPAAQPIYFNVFFSGAKTVSLPRYIQYDL